MTGTVFAPQGRTQLMGIVNVTPDSFSDGGKWFQADAAVAHGVALAEEGADFLDIGGESTRPGATEVEAAVEAARVLPVIRELAGRVAIPLSIDTYKARVAERALREGATIVNDVWGLQRDPDMARVAAEHGAAVVVMHNRTEADPAIDILADALDFLRRSVDLALTAGIAENRIMLDPGIGFGKTFEQNLIMLARLDDLRQLGFPLLVGCSRKSFIGRLTGREAPDRLAGTLGAHLSVRADILRVHDVRAHMEALQVFDAIRAAGR